MRVKTLMPQQAGPVLIRFLVSAPVQSSSVFQSSCVLLTFFPKARRINLFTASNLVHSILSHREFVTVMIHESQISPRCHEISRCVQQGECLSCEQKISRVYSVACISSNKFRCSFLQVIHTLSKLSKSPEAVKSGIRSVVRNGRVFVSCKFLWSNAVHLTSHCK